MKKPKRIFFLVCQDVRSVWKYIAAFLVYDAVVQMVFHQFCPSVIVTGLPCPGCGMTRAVFYFATGQLKKGWEMNPLGILWLILAIYFCVMHYCLERRAKGVLQVGGMLAACMTFFYIYRMYQYFPGDTPISYTSGNLLERMWAGYEAEILKLIGELRYQFRLICTFIAQNA